MAWILNLIPWIQYFWRGFDVFIRKPFGFLFDCLDYWKKFVLDFLQFSWLTLLRQDDPLLAIALPYILSMECTLLSTLWVSVEVWRLWHSANLWFNHFQCWLLSWSSVGFEDSDWKVKLCLAFFWKSLQLAAWIREGLVILWACVTMGPDYHEFCCGNF